MGATTGDGVVPGGGGWVDGCGPLAISTLMSAQFQNSSAYFPLSAPQHLVVQAVVELQSLHHRLADQCASLIFLKYEKYPPSYRHVFPVDQYHCRVQ